MNKVNRFLRRPVESTADAAGVAATYPLQRPLLIAGVVAGLISCIVQDLYIGVAVFCLFAFVGAVWRSDMLPILPACLGYQWLSASTCYIFYHNVGRVPGGGVPTALGGGLLLSMLGLAALVAGFRIGFWIFGPTLTRRTLEKPVDYNRGRVFALTIALFSISYVASIAPRQLWFGGAQIIEALLALRYIPYFLLLVNAFEKRAGYNYVVLATAWVVGPELLTGFSHFKEIMFVIILAALAQWRPWVRTDEQQRQNRRIMAFGVVGAAAVLVALTLWSGGVKSQWRQVIWSQGTVASPVAKIGMFFGVVQRVANDFDVGRGLEMLATRSSSGALYFSYVTIRVPDIVPYEGGRLFGRAIANATQPRFLFPNKANLGGDSWIVRRYAGIAAAGDESGASIGLGYMGEFYIDFGVLGIVAFTMIWGFIGASGLAVLARVSPSREIFLAIMVGILLQYFMAFEGSFIKLLAGMLQRTAIAAVVISMVGPPLQRWLVLLPGRREPRSRWAPAPR